MELPNSLKLNDRSKVDKVSRPRKWPFLLALALAIMVLGYLKATSIAAGYGQAGVGLTGPFSFLRNIGITACLASLALIGSWFRREVLRELSLTLLLPVGAYSIFYLIVLFPRPLHP